MRSTKDLPNKAVIGCVHLLPLPGAPSYRGSVDEIYDVALSEAEALAQGGVDALIVENFRDAPFAAGSVTPATVAAMAAATSAIIRSVRIPVGVAVLRNDAVAALSVAAATGASFIRVNVHVGVALTSQGVIEGNCHDTLRLRHDLGCDVRIFADAQVKHSKQLAYHTLEDELEELSPHCDGVIVSGKRTGKVASITDLSVAKRVSGRPVFVGTGVTADNVSTYFDEADGFVVGSYFKEKGVANNRIDPGRVAALMSKVFELRKAM